MELPRWFSRKCPDKCPGHGVVSSVLVDSSMLGKMNLEAVLLRCATLLPLGECKPSAVNLG